MARAFLAQYKPATDFTPDRLSLQNMEKKHDESFRDYAQRWRNFATQVQSPLTEKEMTMLFLETFQDPYYDWLLPSATRDFSDMIVAGELVDHAIKHGKIDIHEGNGSKKGSSSRRKEGETQALFQENQSQSYVPYQTQPNYQPRYSSSTNPSSTMQTYNPPNNQSNNPGNQRGPRPERFQADPILVSYMELFPKLIQEQLVSRVSIDPILPPYSRWYDPNASCDYHYGVKGHSIENCIALKRRVQALMKAGYIDFNFNKRMGPNNTGNPLPNHPEPKINALSEDCGLKVKDRIDKVKMRMDNVFEMLVQVQLLQARKREEVKKGEQSSQYCKYHNGCMGHTIQECTEF